MPRPHFLLLRRLRPPFLSYTSFPLRRSHATTTTTTTTTIPPSTSSAPPNRPPRPHSTLLRTLSTYALPFLTTYALLLFLHDSFISIMPVTGPSMAPFLNTSTTSSSHSASKYDRDWVWVDMSLPWRIGMLYAADTDRKVREKWVYRWQRWVVGADGLDGQGGKGGWRRGWVVALWSPVHPDKMVTKRVIAIPGDSVTARSPYPQSNVAVPAGHVWVEGDHPESEKSHDSNWYGPVSQSLIVGRVGGVIWPWRRRGRIDGEWRGHDRVKEASADGFTKVEMYRS